MAPGNPSRPRTARPAPVSSAPRVNRFAIVSVVIGILGLFTPYGIAGALAIVLAEIGRRQIRRTGERGRGLAIAGLVIGIVMVALGVALIFWDPTRR